MIFELKASPRTELGRKTKALRRAGFLPAVVYGEGLASTSISIVLRDFEKTYNLAGESGLIKLGINSKEFNVLIHDIVKDPLRGRFLHADLYAVRMDKQVKTKVPLEFIGESPSVKNSGGILVKVMQELEIEALPADLPHALQVDLSVLEAIGSRILVKNLFLPKGVRLIAGEEKVVALVEAPRTEEEITSLKEAPVAGEVTEIKTDKEVKKEAEAKAKAAETATEDAEKR